MNDLSPKARAVVEAGRNPGVFTPMDRDRIRQGLRVRLATLGVVTASAGSAAAMSMTAKIAVVTAVAAVLGGGVATFWAVRGPAPTPGTVARDSSSARPPAVAMPPAATPVPEEIVPPVAPSNEIRKSSKRASATVASATEDRAAPPLDSELSLLRQAREDLRTGAPGTAYQRLVDYDRRYGKGPLWQERQALSAVALCQWRPGPQAQARAAEFLRNAPQSPLADRVRSACQGASAVE